MILKLNTITVQMMESIYDSFALKIKDREIIITDDEAELLVDYITEKLKGN